MKLNDIIKERQKVEDERHGTYVVLRTRKIREERERNRRERQVIREG